MIPPGKHTEDRSPYRNCEHNTPTNHATNTELNYNLRHTDSVRQWNTCEGTIVSAPLPHTGEFTFTFSYLSRLHRSS